MSLNSFINATDNELFIPSRLLNYGVYEVKLSVIMTDYPDMKSSVSIFVHIVHSAIAANLLPWSNGIITQNYRENLTLDPGTYSIDPESDQFKANVSHIACTMWIILSVYSRIGILLSLSNL